MKAKRNSSKQVSAICDKLGLELIKHQMLGDRQNYWYLYSIIDKDDRKPIVWMVSLKKAQEKLNEICLEILNRWQEEKAKANCLAEAE